MNNLKRVLSLGLTGAMLSGMMLVGASAASKDFTDADEIQNKEAVEVMSTLGVLKGKDTGAFDPAGTVTRAEMAKIICVMRNGGVDPTLGTSSNPVYTDVSNHWARSYIEYCSNLNIIAGQGDGTFNPDGQVTGAAAAKMLLVALGYDSDVFGFTGIDWELSVNLQANDAKLYDGIRSIDTSAGLSRDNVAQMAYNALEAKIMDRSFDKVASSGEISYNYFKSTDSFLNKYFDAKIFVGTFEGNHNMGMGAKDEIRLNGRLDTDDGVTAGQLDRNADFPADLDIANIGEEFKVIFKDGKGGVAGKPDKNDTIYGIFNTNAVTVYDITKADLQDAGATNLAKGKIKFNDSLYDVAALAADGDVAIVTNYGAVADVDAGDIDTATSNNQAAGCTAAEFATYINTAVNGLRVRSADRIKFVTDSDSGKIVKAYVETWDYSSVTSLNDKKVQLEGIGSKDLEDVNFIDEVKEDDLVAVATFYGNVAETQIKKAETVQGKVEAKDGTKLRVDGTWYNQAANTEKLSDYDNTMTYTVGNEYKLVLDGGKYYVGGKTVSATVNYAMILKASQGINDQVKLLKEDGTTTTYTINSDSSIKYGNTVNGVTINASMAEANAVMVKYELVKSGSEVKMSAVDAVTDDAAAGNLHTFNKNTKTLTVYNDTAPTSTLAANDAVAFVYANAKWKVYNPNTIGNVTASNNTKAFYTKDSGKIVAFALTSDSTPTGSGDATAYGYVTGVVYTKDNDDNNVVELSVWDGEETQTVVVDGSTSPAAKGDFIQYTVSSAPIGSGDVTSGSNATVKVKEYDTSRNLVVTTTGKYSVSGELVGGSDTIYKMDKNSKIIGVKVDGTKSSTANAITTYTKISGEDYNNAHIIYEVEDGTPVIKAIFVDEDNNIDGAGNAGATYAVAVPTIGAVTGSGYSASNFTVSANKVQAIAGEEVEFTVTYNGTADADDVIALTLTATGSASVVNASTDLTGLSTGKTWVCTATMAAADISAASVAIAVTVN